MQPKDILVFGLDGITVQHVGEIVFEIGSTFESRYESRYTYKQCLEDFAASVLFGDNIAVSGRLPNVKGENPGAMVLEQMRSIHQELEIHTSKLPKDILTDPYYRARVREDLSYMRGAIFSGKKQYWQDLIAREARISLGEHASIYDSNASPDDIVFEGAPHYVQDRDLQNSIDKNKILRVLALSIRKHCDTRITIEALEEFVSRIILTHMTIYWWYEHATIEAKIINRVRIPHITRAVVRSEELNAILKSGKEIAASERLVRQVFVQNALFEALSLDPNRIRLLENLNILRNMSPYDEIRGLWRDVIQESSQEQQNKKIKIVLDEILNEIRGKSSPKKQGKLQLDIELANFRANCWNAVKHAGGFRSKEYSELIYRVFPEILSDTATPGRLYSIIDVTTNHGRESSTQTRTIISKLQGDNITILQGNNLNNDIKQVKSEDTREYADGLRLYAAKMRQIISEYFNESEIRDLCFDLGIDHEKLPGQGKGDKARELIAYAQRHGRFGDLAKRCYQLRPDADWPIDTLPPP